MPLRQVSHLPRLSLIVFIFGGCFFGSSGAYAQVSPLGAPRLGAPIRTVFYDHIYVLSQKEIADASPKTYVWDLERVPNGFAFQSTPTPPPPQKVFKSLKSADLRTWVDGLPSGSMIKYLSNPGSKRKTPATVQAALDDFGRYCESKNVTFAVVSTVG